MKFNELNIIKPILRALDEYEYQEATPIQEKTIPPILAGKDVLATAQTGTGKTAAFAIPILQQIISNKDSDWRTIKALVVVPTRELANQIYENFNIYAKYLKIKSAVIYGGVPQGAQQRTLRKGVDILIATPGRLLDLINQNLINLSEVKHFVLDEADLMFDMGFIKDIKRIIKLLPAKRQTMMFSATMPDQIEKLSQEILTDPLRISTAHVTQTLDLISQEIYYVTNGNKTNLLSWIIKERNIYSALVFVRTKHSANQIVKNLKLADINATAIHSNKSQREREKALKGFKSGNIQILVATDIVARGIDIENLPYVFNYDLPELPETYIHRIGRTGRADAPGKAVSFCTPDQRQLLLDIEKHIKMTIELNIEQPYHVDFIKQLPKSGGKGQNKPSQRRQSKNRNQYQNNRHHRK